MSGKCIKLWDMDNVKFLPVPHPMGERDPVPASGSEIALIAETFSGRVHVEWDPDAAVTPLGQLAFFVDFLKTAELFGPWVADCPLTYASNDAPKPVDVLGTLLLSVLAGHHRYAHITSVRCDGVNPGLLGMSKVVSVDSARRAFRDQAPDRCRWAIPAGGNRHRPCTPCCGDFQKFVAPQPMTPEGAIGAEKP